MGDRQVSVHEEAVYPTFTAAIPQGRRGRSARVLLVAPMSGHFATLRETVRTMLDHESTSRIGNARDVPLAAGPFGHDEYVEHVMKFVK
jgi:poly-beta-hydroxyalkanoate depolymerase